MSDRTSEDSLAKATIAMYVILTIPTLFVAVKHGWRHVLGWAFLFIFLTLKMVGSGLALKPSSGSGASIVNNIGLSPLLLATAGVLHEARFYRASASKSTTSEAQKIETVGTLLFHILVMTGIALVAVGASHLAEATTPDALHSATTLAKVGAAILFLGAIVVATVAIVSALDGHMHPHHASQYDDGTRLLIGVLLALTFLFVRDIMSLAFFASGNKDLGPSTGPPVVKVIPYFLMELAVTLILICAGILTRNIKHHQTDDIVEMGTGPTGRGMGQRS